MKNPDPKAQTNVQHVNPPRQARLHALLFSGAALGTTLLMFGASAEPKFPRFVGE